MKKQIHKTRAVGRNECNKKFIKEGVIGEGNWLLLTILQLTILKNRTHKTSTIFCRSSLLILLNTILI